MIERLQPIEIHPRIKAAIDRWCELPNLADTLFREVQDQGPALTSQLNCLRQAIGLWSHSKLLERIGHDPKNVELFYPNSTGEDPTFHWLANASYLANTAITMRTYVAVVLGRTDPLVSIIRRLHRETQGIALGRAVGILNESEVRILRNAIGHGTFRAWGQVIEYNDNDKHRRISFREVDALNTEVIKIIGVLHTVASAL